MPYRSPRLEGHLASSSECRDRLAVEIEIIRSIKSAGAKLGDWKTAQGAAALPEEAVSIPYTPGPWHICKDHPDWICPHGGGYPVAMVPPGHGAVAAANARLITAAPELVEVLEAFLERRDCPVYSPEAMKARAVLAMARGQV